MTTLGTTPPARPRHDLGSTLLALLAAPHADLSDFARGVARSLTAELGTPYGIGLTLRHHEGVDIAGCSDATTECERALDHEGGSPAAAVLARRQAAVVTDMASAPWRAWGTVALRRGFRAASIVPSTTTTGTALTLTIYSCVPPEAWPSDGPPRDAAALAEDVAHALSLRQRAEHTRRSVEDLRTALDTRAVIDQALGVLMARDRCSADQAMNVLRKEAGRRQVKLRTLAGHIVEHVSGRPAQKGTHFQDRTTVGAGRAVRPRPAARGDRAS
ncbi:ANTAR domain-containing protein [Actinotalea sp. BY-33]|uniref:ANTAR domain-containing protein n=1 Tax=Actinotalea soli TaxID=2819234 RepID=A0A939LNI0_9CELL|nr:ANTAR domain-containing protein [Actinotalea soli]MBO1751677.1 ANTAR domain-containing protein [Actinotalea soli]